MRLGRLRALDARERGAAHGRGRDLPAGEGAAPRGALRLALRAGAAAGYYHLTKNRGSRFFPVFSQFRGKCLRNVDTMFRNYLQKYFVHNTFITTPQNLSEFGEFLKLF